MKLLRVFTAGILSATLLLNLDAHAEKIKIKSASLSVTNGNYRLNTDFEIALNPILEQALKKGVALNFATEFKLFIPRWYWINKKIYRHKQIETISYYALTQQYRLNNGLLSQNFRTLKEALQVLSQLRSHPITPILGLQEDMGYIAELRIWLDLSRLPKPFQVEAFNSEEWSLGSDELLWNIGLPLQKSL
ncbi:MAG: DUF4390 domain-containing protein [Nitrosomonadaceae bacterium]|nr:DUF4390 domain-containing protein [Nitrosomonadaceae bacterium]MDW7653079.1 DUF4390 domain-containing protein [Nitrosomonadaceae bacterium]MDW7663503.1 DUF4390 domain-containing protein [Nitrosomonadaceae bacterium]MDW7664934.1 DUF4390 domain-containing protein [Nitrosomonadaceae bacterium]